MKNEELRHETNKIGEIDQFSNHLVKRFSCTIQSTRKKVQII